MALSQAVKLKVFEINYCVFLQRLCRTKSLHVIHLLINRQDAPQYELHKYYKPSIDVDLLLTRRFLCASRNPVELTSIKSICHFSSWTYSSSLDVKCNLTVLIQLILSSIVNN
jgi:hypothetical protein